MKHLIGITFAAFLTSSCATQTFDINGGSAAAPSREGMQHFFISGLGQGQHINAAAICGSAANVAKVEVQQSLVDGLLGIITLGVYTPRDARVYCRR